MKLIKLQDKFILVSDESKVNGDDCIHLTTFNRSVHHDIDNNLTKWWKIIGGIPETNTINFNGFEEELSNITTANVEVMLENNVYLITKIIQSPQQTSWDVEVNEKSHISNVINNILSDLEIEIDISKKNEERCNSLGYFEGVILNQASIRGLEVAVKIVKKHLN